MMIAAAFLSGITMATFFATGLFFFKFWRASSDRFFLFFGIACWLIAMERIIGLFIHETLQSVRTTLEGAGTWIYLVRLSAFTLILIAVIAKNRRNSSRF